MAGGEAAGVLGKGYPTQFNQERERRQLVLDPIRGLVPYPVEYRADGLDEAARVAKAEFDSTHHLVVVEWGGQKAAGRSWEYSRRQCRDVAERGVIAELEARQRIGLSVVSPELGGPPPRRPPGRPPKGSRSDQERVSDGSEGGRATGSAQESGVDGCDPRVQPRRQVSVDP